MAKAQWLEIDLGGTDIPFYCPYCGCWIYKPEGQLTSTFCPHVEFIFIDVAGDYEYATPAMRALLKKLEEQEEECPMPNEQGMLDYLPPDTVVFGLTTSGLACAPTSSTMAVGIRWNVGPDQS